MEIEKSNIKFIIIITILFLIIIFGLFYNPFQDNYYTITGHVVYMESSEGGCQHTDWSYVGFDDGRYFYCNPSVEIIDTLPVNVSYTFYLQDFDMGDGPGSWLDRIDNEYGDEIWRSCRYE